MVAEFKPRYVKIGEGVLEGKTDEEPSVSGISTRSLI
jgi:hypothetical protein